jgi:hypothetical protein
MPGDAAAGRVHYEGAGAGALGAAACPGTYRSILAYRLSSTAFEFRRICGFRSEEGPDPPLVFYATLASTNSSCRLPSGAIKLLHTAVWTVMAGSILAAASGGLHGALPLGAPVDGIRRLRMRGARREPRQMPADGLGGLH